MARNPIGLVIGLILTATAALMLLPAIVDLADGHRGWVSFAASAAITGFVGVALYLGSRFQGQAVLTTRRAFLLTVIAWIAIPGVAALPLTGLGYSFTDAFFETMSGLTTTGSTVLSQLDEMPRGILLWRALLQWIGGIGIIVMAVLLLPMLRIGGMQLFRIESSEKRDKAASTAAGLVTRMMLIYAGLTLACGFLYQAFGMTTFDAVCHAMTTVATAGFSTHDASFIYFNSPVLEWTAVVFMLAGACPFIAYIHMTGGRLDALVSHPEVRALFGLIVAVSIVMAVWLIVARDFTLHDAIRKTMFNVTSIVTTTGYINADYHSWGPQVVGVFFILTFVGGCAGSTSGAVKIYRHQIVLMMMTRHLKTLISPNRVVSMTYRGKPISSAIVFSVVAFFAAYFITFAVAAIALTFAGHAFVTAVSGAATAISNVGPGLGPIIGPAGNFAALDDPSKWILALAMMLGRLELLGVLVLLNRDFWK